MLCPYCNTFRPANEAPCPQCGAPSPLDDRTMSSANGNGILPVGTEQKPPKPLLKRVFHKDPPPPPILHRLFRRNLKRRQYMYHRCTLNREQSFHAIVPSVGCSAF